MERETIIAMAVAVIAEDLHTDAKHIRIKQFKELDKSPLQVYVEEYGLNYKKYQLGD